jgi:hypothetical protein
MCGATRNLLAILDLMRCNENLRYLIFVFLYNEVLISQIYFAYLLTV